MTLKFKEIRKKASFNKLIFLSLLILLLLISQNAYSKTLDEIMEAAMENSPTYKNYQMQYQNGLLKLQELSAPDLPELNFSVAVDALGYDNKENKDGTYSLSMSPNFSYASSDGKTKLSAKMDYLMGYKDSQWILNPSLKVGHTFDFTGFSSDELDDLTFASTKLATEESKVNADYTFRKLVLTSIRQLFQAEKQIERLKFQLKNAEKSLKDMKELGTYLDGSLTMMQAESAVSTLSSSLEIAQKQMQQAKENFEVLSGFTWDGLSDVPEAKLEVKILKNGNTNVIQSQLQAEIAKESYNQLYSQIYPEALFIELGGGGNFYKNDYLSNSVNTSASIMYQGKNWSLGATPSLSVSIPSNSSSFISSASLTIVGSWSNNSRGQNEESELARLQNNAIIKQNEYLSALTDYNQKGQNLVLSVFSWNNKKELLSTQINFDKEKEKNLEELFNQGLAVSEELEEAKLTVQEDEYEWKDLMLEGLSLECDINIFNL